jgi:hypothetical protein
MADTLSADHLTHARVRAHHVDRMREPTPLESMPLGRIGKETKTDAGKPGFPEPAIDDWPAG